MTAPPSNEHPSFERCRAVEKLSSGPLTDLYRAVQLPLERPVLVKTLSGNVLPASPFAAALEREAALLSSLSHPNILRLYDFFRRDDAMWIVLEDADGPSLDQLLAKARRLSPHAAAAIALQIARGLAHAHARGIVHRDVQPKNVFVARDGTVKLTNFSVATDERLPTAPELLDGKAGFDAPSYMSPEQVLGEAPDPRSDLFSLGVVLYEMLSGKRPFDAPDSRAATQRIRHDAPQPLTRTVPDLPPQLDRIVTRCLQKMPSDRFYSAGELCRALEAALPDGEPPDQWVLKDLGRAGFARPGAPAERERRSGFAHKTGEVGLWYAARGYIACLIFIAAGAAFIEYAAEKSRSEQPHGETRLPLVPPRAAYLRVVADPWAHVIVDGQRVDTTPFAHAIPLSAGVHYVRLEHPNAPVERRTVRLSAGETVLLDVKMDVTRPKPPSAAVTKIPVEPDTP